jgi:hypothetical protein
MGLGPEVTAAIGKAVELVESVLDDLLTAEAGQPQERGS